MACLEQRISVPGAGRGKVSHFSPTDITGPIVLQTYRAVADYEKSSTSEMALKAGDMVDVVEKSESGTCLFLQRAPKGQPPPGHHLRGNWDCPCISCPNAACEVVTPVRGLEGRRLHQGLLIERRSSEQTQPVAPNLLVLPAPLGHVSHSHGAT